MAYTSLDTNDLDVGDPVKKELWDTVKSNEDDHETRLNSLEGGANKIQVFNMLILNAANFITTTAMTGFAYYRAEAAFTLVGAEASVLDAGTSGTFEFDILKSSTLGGSFTTVFSTKPSVAFGAGDDATSSNAAFSVTTVSQNDWLRLDITSLQSPQRSFHVRVFGETS